MRHPSVLLVGTRGFPLFLAAVVKYCDGRLRARPPLPILRTAVDDCIRRFAVLCTGYYDGLTIYLYWL